MNQFIKRVSITTIFLFLTLFVINIGDIFNIPNLVDSIENIVSILSQQSSLDEVSYIFRAVLTIATIFIAAISIIFGIQNIPFRLVTKYYLSGYKVTTFISLTIFLLLLSPLYLFIGSTLLVNLLYFKIVFYCYIISSILFVGELVNINNPRSILDYILSPRQLHELKDITAEATDIDSGNFEVTTNKFEIATRNLDYRVSLNINKEGIFKSIDFDRLELLFGNEGIDINNLLVLLTADSGSYFPDVFDFFYRPNSTKSTILTFCTNDENLFNDLRTFINSNEKKLENLIIFQEESEAINKINTQIDDIILLIKSNKGLDQININWLNPIKKFIEEKRNNDDEITEIETIVIYRFIRKLTYELDISLSNSTASDIIKFLYRIMPLVRSSEESKLGKIALDLMDSVSNTLLSNQKENAKGKVYGLVLRYKELSVPFQIHTDGTVLNSDYLKFICFDAIKRSTLLIFNVVNNRGFYKDYFISKFLEYNLQDMISFLSSFKQQRTAWVNEASEYLAKQILYIASLIYKHDKDYILTGYTNKLLFPKFGKNLIKYSYNSSYKFRSDYEVLNHFVNNHNFNQPDNPNISKYFEEPLHKSGGHTPEYFDFKNVWISYLLLSHDIPEELNPEVKQTLINKIQNIDTAEESVISKICDVEVERIHEKLEELRVKLE